LIVGIHQPAYLPWLGYFDRIRSADLFIILDTVQFQKGSFQNRNKVLTSNGPIWLTVPVHTAGNLFNTTLKDIRIDNERHWQSKHWSTLRMNYSAAPEFEKIAQMVAPIYKRQWSSLSDLCWEMLQLFNCLLHINTQIVKASDLGFIEGKKSELIMNLCREVNADVYLSGSQGLQYLEEEKFAANGISISYQNYLTKPYRQNSNEFIPALGVIDLLFNEPEPWIWI
jgi:hypothetical protein